MSSEALPQERRQQGLASLQCWRCRASCGLLAAVIVLASAMSAAAQTERVVDIRVHGNHTTPAADIIGLSGLAVGDAATEARLQQAQESLRQSGRFEGIDVRRRYASIADPTAILVMIVVDERDAATADTPLPGPLRRFGAATMWMPVLSYADGYGFTYGVRFAFVDPLGPRTRFSVPLTWGGDRRAALEAERTFEHGPITALRGALSAYRRENPHVDAPDVRLEARAQAERAFTRWLRAGVSVRTARVDFLGVEAQHTAAGVGATVDTRLDPSFPRNAVYATGGWERLSFKGGSAGRWSGDARGYPAIGGSNVLALQALFTRADAPLPLAEQALVGGSGSLRGYRTGHLAGDSTAAASVELRVPLSSPLTFARVGVKGFVDIGAAWPSGERLRDQRFDRGIGGGVYAGIAGFMLNVDVAWSESGRARAHVGLGVPF